MTDRARKKLKQRKYLWVFYDGDLRQNYTFSYTVGCTTFNFVIPIFEGTEKEAKEKARALGYKAYKVKIVIEKAKRAVS